MTLLTARLRKLETKCGINDPFSLLTDEELETAIASLDEAIRTGTGMSPDEYAEFLKEAGKQRRLDNDHAWELVRGIKSGEIGDGTALTR
jgi:hypothetical protein